MTEVARMLSISPRTVSNFVDKGHLKGYKLPSGFRRVKKADLIMFCLDNKMPIPNQLIEEKVFDEKALYKAIVRLWGASGAHVEIYKSLCKKAGVDYE